MNSEVISPSRRILLNIKVAGFMLIHFKLAGAAMQIKGIGRALHDWIA